MLQPTLTQTVLEWFAGSDGLPTLVNVLGDLPYYTRFFNLAPQNGIEPLTERLTAVSSAAELLGNWICLEKYINGVSIYLRSIR